MQQDSGNPLPVSLLYFNADCLGHKTVFNWSTASEINNDRFEIFKSIDGENWESIGQIFGSGNSNSQIEYKYEVTNDYSGFTYYKLVQYDYDNTETEIGLVTTDCELESNLNVYVKPNPVKDIMTIVSEYELRNIEFVITNTLGEIVLSGRANGFITNIDMQNLLPEFTTLI